jgi:signal peptidase II
MKKKISILIIISFLVILVDRITKVLVTRYIPLNKIVTLIKKVFYLTNVHNVGAAFSILENKTFLLIFFSILFLLLIVFFMYKYKKYNFEFAFIIGGLLGNLIDRIIYGYVIDFIGINIFKYSFPIFNIADSLIVIGAIIFLLRKEKVGEKHENNS